jgi:hypothetical protein
MINNISGDIRISVWKEDKVKIEAIKRQKPGMNRKPKSNGRSGNSDKSRAWPGYD